MFHIIWKQILCYLKIKSFQIIWQDIVMHSIGTCFHISDIWKQVPILCITVCILKSRSYSYIDKSRPYSYIAAYHGTNLCSFCNLCDETDSHLFHSCYQWNGVWNFVVYLLIKLTGYALSAIMLTFCLYFDFSFLFAAHCNDTQINCH